MTSAARTTGFILLGAVPLLVVMELCARFLLLSPGPVRALLDDQERRDAQRLFGELPREDRTHVEIVGTSLSGGVATALEDRLQSELGGDYHAFQRSRAGIHLGDQIAEVLESADPDHVTMLEFNLWTYNERKYRYSPVGDWVVARLWQHAGPLAEHGDASMRRALVRQSGLEDLLAGWVFRRVASYYLPQCFKGGIRNRIGDLVLGTPPQREPPPAWERAITRNNIRGKDLDSGPDTPTLDLFLDWIDAHPEQTRSLVVFFPPLNERYIEKAIGPDSGKWREVIAWRDQLTRRLSSLGVTVLDYTELLDRRPEYFKDYGHLQSEAFPVVADRMLADLLERGLLRRPSDRSRPG